MLKVPDHQVAGHKASDGVLGPLIDDSGLFYKPLQNDGRGSNELAFYTTFTSDARIPYHIFGYFPKFYGTKVIEASDGSGLHPHLVLQDIVFSFENPSLMDIKIGSRTWFPQASDDYIDKCFKRDRETSSLSLGFRISGLQMFGTKDSGFWKPQRKLTQNLNSDQAKLLLRKFVSSNMPAESDVCPDSALASNVYGGFTGVLEQLLELKAWFEKQTIYHFYSCSIIIVYEKEEVLNGKSSGAIVKLVDFAHVLEGNGVIDHNFLGGLCSFIKFISEILTSPEENCISSTNGIRT
ncbi:Inositol polyphosphate multikinase [Quillaja saponaria]|uniref:Inositol polyphosphate multikinase n=1 Tax=Quillaja saponaria TaxID=32244 RepID=A0AAD7PRZ1_QUISA|nr:Inositol polyphosphate multikinase [Quillaja saponaria]